MPDTAIKKQNHVIFRINKPIADTINRNNLYFYTAMPLSELNIRKRQAQTYYYQPFIKQNTMTELERLNEALREAFAKIGITKKTDMAAHIPYRFSYFSEVTTGHKPMSRLFLNKLYERMGINPQWVRTGEGEMLVKPAAPKAETSSRRQSSRIAKAEMQQAQAMFNELKEQLAEKDRQLAEKDEQLSKRDAQIDRLMLIIENLSGN